MRTSGQVERYDNTGTRFGVIPLPGVVFNRDLRNHEFGS